MVGKIDVSTFSDDAIDSLMNNAQIERQDNFLYLENKTLWIMWGDNV